VPSRAPTGTGWAGHTEGEGVEVADMSAIRPEMPMRPGARTFPRDEVEEAFARYFSTGPVQEDWEAWVDLMTDDVFYVDHWWGPLYGKEEVKIWIAASMGGVPEIYTVLDWYTIQDDTVVFHMQNRRDNPDPDGPPYFDFPGLSVATYAGDGKWSGEEDFWDLSGARRTAGEYARACEKMGVTDADDRITRKYWPESPSWARYDGVPKPSWIAGSIPGVTRPSQLAALLEPLRAARSVRDSGGHHG